MINTWNESFLHESLKERYGEPSDILEAPVNGSICDVLHADGSITEIQTAHLSKLRQKVEKLVADRKIRIVYPIAQTLRLETRGSEGELISSRKSPKKGTIFQIFPEITGLYQFFDTGQLTLEILFADITEYRIADGTGSWRRKGVRIDNRKLNEIHGSLCIRSKADLLALLPLNLPETFTTKDLKLQGAGRFAGHMVWVLKKLNVLEKIGSRDRCYLYRVRE